MTPRETLEKYGLKTDVKSIRERAIEHNEYKVICDTAYPWGIDLCDFEMLERSIAWRNLYHQLHDADLTLLCELAEKGEKLSHEIQRYFELDRIKWGFTKMQLDEYSALICALSKEGEPK